MTKNDPVSDAATKALSNLEEENEQLQAQIEQLELSLSEAKGQAVRAVADLDNFKRRESENKKNWVNFGLADFLKKLLPSFLELGLGASHTSDEEMKKVVDKFFVALTAQGVVKVEPQAGEEVDPAKHEVLMTEEGETGKVVRVLEPGWMYGDQVLVPAKVSAGNEQ